MKNNIFLHSLKESVFCKVWKFLLGGVGSIVAILLFGVNFLKLSITCSILLGVTIIVIIYLTIFLYFLIRNINQAWRNFDLTPNTYTNYNSIYGEAIIDLKDACACIHAIRRKKKGQIINEEFMNLMVQSCDTVKKIFDRKTNVNCCVSIKVTINKNPIPQLETLIVRNLCRDSSHKSRNTEAYNAIRHTIIGNTPYRFIVDKILTNNKSKFAYVNNDIENTQGYDNTSREAYDNDTLPYRSELVYPIVPVIPNSAKNVNNNYDLCGFICIDCPEKDKFEDTKYDIPMIEVLADGIYDIIQNMD